jgi:hypothetical protein
MERIESDVEAWLLSFRLPDEPALGVKKLGKNGISLAGLAAVKTLRFFPASSDR